ncbi:MAG: mprA 2 [Ferruginibacter sp.]|uniref:response regulator transcription factor n=1 Tax=Ferruginibacter sp. TaxID=1940288 RepID=UPI00265898AB|nr:response regulator [Ferruginibacter sp.]MDB5280205.1 mprA 2 [Ferruginibacter sp.]
MPHVLIMDDETDLLEMVGFGLTMHGFTTMCVSERADFFSELATRPPDVILIDIYLGTADGREICKQIKESKDFSHISVILYSAGNIPDESIMQSGAGGFVSKPFGVQELAEKLLSLCK